MYKFFIAIVVAVTIIGCSTTQIKFVSVNSGYWLECGRTTRTWDKCLEQADQYCNHKYEITGYDFKYRNDVLTDRKAVVVCK